MPPRPPHRCGHRRPHLRRHPARRHGASAPGAPVRFRLLYSGTVATGVVTVALQPGTWHDSAGNANVGSSSTVRLITRGSSFYIELSGGILLQAAGLTSEPLMDLKAEVILEIDSARKVFTLTFDGQLSIIKLGPVGATAGRFVLDMGDPSSSVPKFWGVASIETNFSKLQPYGLDLYGKGFLEINTTSEVKNETLTLKGLGAGGADLTRSFTLQPYSFGLELVAADGRAGAGHLDRAVPGPGRLLPRLRRPTDARAWSCTSPARSPTAAAAPG